MPLLGLVVAGVLASGACVGLSARHVRKLARHRPLSPPELTARLQALGLPEERARFQSELKEQADEAERAVALATLVPRSLARISLASGTAIALTSLAKGLGSGLTGVPGGLIEFAVGFTGMVVCSYFGRQARELATEVRLGWRAALKVAARE